MNTTAFVSHSDCALHDPGWGHPEHQGRLPGLMRAVYRDMLTLFEPLLELEGRHAGEEELRLVHDGDYLERVRGLVASAQEGGQPVEVAPGLMVSGASWAASTAAVGCCIAAVDAVLEGRVRNAFCAIRPPGRDAGADSPGRFGFLNPLAVAVRRLRTAGDDRRVLVVEWGGVPDAVIDTLDPGVLLLPAASSFSSGRSRPDSPASFEEDPAAGSAAGWLHAMQDAVAAAAESFAPDFIILSAGFDGMAGDPLGGGVLEPGDFHAATCAVRDVAEAHCDGRLVSILEGGYDAARLGEAVVQHLRGLAGLPAAD